MGQSRLFYFVQWSAIAVFVGRGWQHVYWEAPYRALLWDEEWMKWLVEGLLGMEWRVYASSPVVDQSIEHLITLTGVFYFLCAVTALFIKRLGRAGRVVLYLGSLNLIFLAALYCKEKFFFAGQFFEYTLQWSAPVFLAVLARKEVVGPRLFFWMKIAIALTFTCHGLYAIGYYPRPGNFMEMVMNILPLQEAGARHFLIAAGVLDFLASILLFWPWRVSRLALAYTALWGFATTMARLLAYFHWVYWDTWLEQGLQEVLIRFPHFLIPAGLLAYFWPRRNEAAA
ncbi:MAG: hypothetical protein KDD02_11245 [Phaeodactylibacter sp.]|nr:hypothetical protein [Phaeodactylibacter sp.]MCB9303990.1 hypothetical protein [Lewinellaceae bacterium]HQU60879.1 hypothetical protein [Saprospiraceae bacterium]